MKVVCEYCDSYVEADENMKCPLCGAALGTAVQSEQERPLLLAAIKRCQAEMELFALAADSDSAKRMYARNSDRMQDVIDMLKPILKE